VPYGRLPSDPWIGRVVVVCLGLCALAGMAGIFTLQIYHAEIPPALTGFVGLCFGALTTYMYALMRHSEAYERGKEDERQRDGGSGPVPPNPGAV
jgi:hypothetical protein